MYRTMLRGLGVALLAGLVVGVMIASAEPDEPPALATLDYSHGTVRGFQERGSFPPRVSLEFELDGDRHRFTYDGWHPRYAEIAGAIRAGGDIEVWSTTETRFSKVWQLSSNGQMLLSYADTIAWEAEQHSPIGDAIGGLVGLLVVGGIVLMALVGIRSLRFGGSPRMAPHEPATVGAQGAEAPGQSSDPAPPFRLRSGERVALGKNVTRDTGRPARFNGNVLVRATVWEPGRLRISNQRIHFQYAPFLFGPGHSPFYMAPGGRVFRLEIALAEVSLVRDDMSWIPLLPGIIQIQTRHGAAYRFRAFNAGRVKRTIHAELGALSAACTPAGAATASPGA
jgi:hypothetical protein